MLVLQLLLIYGLYLLGISARPQSTQFVPGDLQQLLSVGASVTQNISSTPRWSDFGAPSPGAIVNVATEQDVATVVKYCTTHNIPFLAQNGGHGWIDSFDLHKNGVIINLAKLNAVKFNANKTQARIGGGTLVSQAIDSAYATGVQLQTGNCNCVGALGAYLGGGYGNLMGLHGFGVDSLLSMNVVTAAGELVTVTPTSNPDLWWAMRGAGPNFGIVTSALVKSYPIQPQQNFAWQASLIFTEDKIEPLVTAINNLVLEPDMVIFMYYVTTASGNASAVGAPAVLVTPFYYGSAADGEKAFASIFAVGPVSNTSAENEYPHWNDGAAGFCIKGDRKPSYGAAFARMVPSTWRAVWDEFVEWAKEPGTADSLVLLEAYSLQTARSVSSNSSAFPFRSDVNFNAVVIPWYADPKLDAKAEAFGSRVRDLFRATDELAHNSTYINFAHGDESLRTVYGDNVARLQALKARYDPRNAFGHWFSLASQQ